MKMTATTADAYRLFHDGSLALARAERNGIRIDVDYCNQKMSELDKEAERLQKELKSTKLYVAGNTYTGQKLTCKALRNCPYSLSSYEN
jgi:hypothetical protein